MLCETLDRPSWDGQKEGHACLLFQVAEQRAQRVGCSPPVAARQERPQGCRVEGLQRATLIQRQLGHALPI